METIIEKVQQLPAANAIEAAKTVASAIADEPVITEDEFETEFGDPFEHIADMEEFARILLINAAERPKYRDLVDTAITNVGKKQLVLGGPELVMLVALGVAALRIMINPVSEEKFKYTDKNGTKVEHTRTYNNSTNFLSRILGKYLK